MRESMHDVAGKKGDTNEPDGRHGTREHAELCSPACPEACPQAAWYERACFVPAGVPVGVPAGDPQACQQARLVATGVRKKLAGGARPPPRMALGQYLCLPFPRSIEFARLRNGFPRDPFLFVFS